VKNLQEQRGEKVTGLLKKKKKKRAKGDHWRSSVERGETGKTRKERKKKGIVTRCVNNPDKLMGQQHHQQGKKKTTGVGTHNTQGGRRVGAQFKRGKKNRKKGLFVRGCQGLKNLGVSMQLQNDKTQRPRRSLKGHSMGEQREGSA